MLKKNYKNIKNSYIFDSLKPGNTITIFSGIHGDEVSGVFATEKFIEELKKGTFAINSGRLIIVTHCNEIAIKEGNRYDKINLNRLFFKGEKGNSYEENRSEELMSILEESDYFLDLHSTPGPSIPFLFSEIKNFELAKKIGISHIIGGWGEFENGVISGDTENYLNKLGGVGFTFEAGNHNHPEGGKNAYQMILNFLSALEIIDYSYFNKVGKDEVFLKIKDFYKAESDNFKFFIDLDNFTKLSKGTLIGLDNGKEVYAEEDMILLMPKEEDIIEKGIEVFFIGKEFNY